MSFDFDFELDRTFYLIGLIIGASRRVASRVPHEVKNFGKPPNVDWTENRVKSLAIGIKTGHNYIFECKTPKTNVGQSQRPIVAYKDMISITLPTKYVSQGDTVTLPVTLSRQAKEKFGTKQFQLVLGYNSTYLTCIGVESSEPWLENFAYAIQEGRVAVQGGRPTPIKDDTTLCYITFKVAQDTYGSLPLKIIGSPGTNVGTELLVIDEDNDLAYITPVNYEHGKFVLEGSPSDKILGSDEVTMPGSSYVGSGSYIDYNFGASFNVADGVVLGGGVNVKIKIYLDGELIGSEKIPLEKGDNDYAGKIPLEEEPLKQGEIKIEIEIECENEEDSGFIYVYIKAGGIFSLVSGLTKDEAEQLKEVRMLEKQKTSVKLGSYLTMNIVEEEAPLDLSQLGSSVSVGSYMTMSIVEETVPPDLSKLGSSLGLGSYLTMHLVEEETPTDLNSLGSGAHVGSYLTMHVVEEEVPPDLSQLGSGVKLGSIVTMSMLDEPKPLTLDTLKGLVGIGSYTHFKN